LAEVMRGVFSRVRHAIQQMKRVSLRNAMRKEERLYDGQTQRPAR
jgi:hypothetical protein